MDDTNQGALLEPFQSFDYDYLDLGDSLPATQFSEVRIHDIQGTGLRSLLDGQTVNNVPGIVTAVDSNGFYLQDPNPDNNAATSEGIFVFTGSRPTVRVGDSIEISGIVSEFRPGGDFNNLTTTQIGGSPTVNILSRGNALPETRIGAGDRTPPTEVIFPSGVFFYESLEGMRVTAQDVVAVSPTNIRANSSELWAVLDQGAGATGINSRGGITISPNDFNPERIQIDDRLFTSFSNPPVNVGDLLGDVTGVVSYGFGNYQFLVTEPYFRTAGGLQPEVTHLTGTSDRLTISSYNVENLNPFAGVRFEGLASHIIDNLKSPDIIALQEIQDNNGAINDGTVDASLSYQLLIDAISAAGGPTYQFFDIAPENNQDGGQPGSNIRPGYFFNPNRVGLVPDSVRRIVDTDLSDGDAFEASRKPLVATFTFNGQAVTTINNHLTSRGGSTPLFGDPNQLPTIRGEQQREDQARIINSEVDKILATNPNANAVVLGDLNGFYFEEFQQILKGGDTPVLTNLYDTLPETERYSYVFQGNSQALDHIIVSNNLVSQAQFDAVHINSEFVDQLSDHDPLVTSLYLPTQSPQPSSFTLQILHASDQEAGVPAFRDIPGFSAVMNALTGRYANSLKLTSGDVFIASPFFNASRDIYSNAATGNPADQPGIADILIQNELGWNVASVGNHEFTGGDSTFLSLLAPNANLVNGAGGVGIGAGGYPGALFPYLANNLDYSNARLPNGLTVVENGSAPLPNTLTGSVVTDVNGEKVGIIGIVTPYLKSIANTGLVEVTTKDANGNDITGTSSIDVQVDSIIANITPEVQALTNAGINKIVLMTHLQESAIEQALGQKMADLGLEVDILLGGGSHQLMSSGNLPLREDETQQNSGQLLQPFPQEFSNGTNKVLFVNSAPNYRYLNQLVVTFDGNGVITSVGDDSGSYATDIAGVDRLYAENITTIEGVKAKADPEIVAIAAGAQALVNALDGNIFGQADVFLNGIRGDVRTQETNLGNLSAESQDFYAEAYLAQYNLLPGFNEINISFKNGGTIRDFIGQSTVETLGSNQLLKLPTQANPEVGKEAGDISQLDISNSLRFDSDLVVGTVNAAGFLQLAEHMISSVETGNGRFGQISGFNFSFNPGVPAGDRIQSLALANEAGESIEAIVENGALVVASDRTFSVVTSRFLAEGGDSYPTVISNLVNLTNFAEPDSLGRSTLVSGREQDALAEFLAASFNRENGQTPYSQADTSQAGDERIQNLNFRGDTVLNSIAGAGNAMAYGDVGNDLLSLGNGNNRVFANEGNDVINTGSGNDLIYADAGDDAITAGNGNNIVYAREGNNRVVTGLGNDIVWAGMGNNSITTGAGDDLIYVSGGGINTINAGIGNDTVIKGWTGNGVDTIALNAGSGSVTIFGFDSDDKLTRSSGLVPSDVLTITKSEFDTTISKDGDLLATLKWYTGNVNV